MRSVNSFVLFAAAAMLFAVPVRSEEAIDGPESVAAGKSAVFRVPKSIAGTKYSWDVLPRDGLNYLKITEDDGSPAIILLDVEKPVYLSFVSFDGEIHFTRILTIEGTPPPLGPPVGGDPPKDDPPVVDVARNIFVLVVTDSSTDAQRKVWSDPALKQFVKDSKHRLGPYAKSEVPAYVAYLKDYEAKGGTYPAVLLQDDANRNILTMQPLPASATDLQGLIQKHTRK